MSFFGVSSKNQEQKQALKALSSDKPFTFLTGPAGVGKSLLAQAVGLENVLEDYRYRKLNYTRLQTQVGMDVGALPGNLNEKTYPFIAPFLDNLEVMSAKPEEITRYFTEGDDKKRKIFFDTIQTVRGRSLHHSYAIFDEVQNLDAHTFGAAATRIPPGSKFIFLGNFSQIDNARLRNPKNNGLYQLLNGLYERDAHEYFDHVNLVETQRHPIVKIVEDILRSHDPIPEFEELEKRGNV